MAAVYNDICDPPPDSLDEIVTCAVCLEIYTNPRLLNCHHSFCEACLEGLAGYHIKRGVMLTCIACPLCTKVTDMTQFGGIKSLPCDFRSGQMITVITDRKKKASAPLPVVSEVKCDVCSGGARDCCLDCEMCLCENCTLEHQTDNDDVHTVIPVWEQMYCLHHQKRIVNTFCETCDKFVCVVCLHKHNKNHSLLKMKDWAQYRSHLIQGKCELAKMLPALQWKEKKKAEMFQSRFELLSKTKNTIRALCDDFVCDVNTARQECEEEMRASYSTHLEKMNLQCPIEWKGEEMGNLLTDLTISIEGSPELCLKTYKMLNSRAEEMRLLKIKDPYTVHAELLRDTSLTIPPVLERFSKKIEALSEKVITEIRVKSESEELGLFSGIGTKGCWHENY